MCREKLRLIDTFLGEETLALSVLSLGWLVDWLFWV